MKSAILYLISSVNTPVFGIAPFVIKYPHDPKVGEAFRFGMANKFNQCHLSIVQSLESHDGYIIINTLNSKYALYSLPKENKYGTK